MLNLTVIGDDLTGTADCVSLGVRCGCKVRVIFGDDIMIPMPAPSSKEVIGVNIGTRTFAGKEAYATAKRVTEQLRGQNDQLVIKKMDTGFRGNAAYEIEGMLDALDKNVCFILEHIPIRKTFTLYGNQYSAGQLLEKSVFARDDRLKSQKESYIPSILAKGTSLPIGTVDIDAVKGGRIVEATREQIDAGKRIIVFDAITFEDGLNTIKQLQPIYPNCLWAGTTGIVEAALTYLYGELRQNIKSPQNARCIAFSGTAYQATEEQIAYTQSRLDFGLLEINIDRVLNGDETAIGNIVREALRINASGRDVLIRQRLSPDRDKPGVERVIESALCRCANEICAKAVFDRIAIVGGETSQAILSALGVKTIFMDDPIYIGCAFGVLGDGPFKGKQIAIKGGSIGPIEVLLRLLDKEDSTKKNC